MQHFLFYAIFQCIGTDLKKIQMLKLREKNFIAVVISTFKNVKKGQKGEQMENISREKSQKNVSFKTEEYNIWNKKFAR